MIKKRNIFLYFLFNVLTLGIYGIVVHCQIGKEVNQICDDDGRHQMHYLLALLLGCVTCGIFTLIWIKTCMDRLRDHAYRYGVQVEHSGTEYLLWVLVGWMLGGIGPIIGTAYFLVDINQYADIYGCVEPLPYTDNMAERAMMKNDRNYRPQGLAGNAQNQGGSIENDFKKLSGDTTGHILCIGGTYRGMDAPIPDGTEFVIGRDPRQCNFVLDDSFTKISGKHVAVRYNAYNSMYDITDYSTNGTFLSNGSRLQKGVTVRYPKGVEIRLADGENAFQLN